MQLTRRDNQKWYVFLSETGKATDISIEDVNATKVGAWMGRRLGCHK